MSLWGKLKRRGSKVDVEKVASPPPPRKGKIDLLTEQHAAGVAATSSLRTKHPVTWSASDVSVWVAAIGLKEHASAMLEHDLCGQELLSLTTEDMVSVGISSPRRQKKLTHKVKELVRHTDHAFDEHSVSASESDSDDTSDSTQVARIKLMLESGDSKFPLSIKRTSSWERVKAKFYECVESSAKRFYFGEDDASLVRIDTESVWKGLLLMVKEDDNTVVRIVAKSAEPNEPNDAEVTMCEALVDAVIYLDTKGTVLYASTKIVEDSGYSAHELVGKNIKMLMPKNVAREHDSYLAKYLKTGVKSVIGPGRSVQMQRKDGSLLKMWLSVTEQKNDTGRHVFIGLMHRLREGEATDSDSPFVLLDNIQSPVFVIDTLGIVQFANKRATQTLGYSIKELLGKNIKILMPEPFASEHDEYLRRYVSSGVAAIIGKGSRNVLCRHKDGELMPIALSVSEMVVDGRRCFVGNMVPRGEDSDSEEDDRCDTLLDHTRGVVNSLSLPAAIINTKGIVQAFNQAATEVFGYTLGEMAGRNISKIMTGDARKSHTKYIQRWITTRTADSTGSTRKVVGKNKAGELVPLTVAISWREQDDQLLFVGVMIPDVDDAEEGISDEDDDEESSAIAYPENE